MSVDVAYASRTTPQSWPSTDSGLRNPLDPERRIHAVLFDLDGTLYRQAPLRAIMALELLALPLLFSPLRAPRYWRALGAYRRAQEHLRSGPSEEAETPGRAQLIAAGRAANIPLPELESLVDEWMFRRPLKYLRLLRAPGLPPLLEWLTARGIRTGVLSDYPAAAKLTALQLGNQFSLVLSATDPDIGRLKPHPRGFLRACDRWRLHPREVLVVGDRPDVDAAGAAAAGMPCVIIRRSRADVSSTYLPVSSFKRLHRVLEHRR
jgi:HAD superfamily hydrolase (TIGR01509 family)